MSNICCLVGQHFALALFSQPHNKMEFEFMHKRPLKKLLCAVAATVGLSAGLNASAADPLKVGFVYIGPIGDHGWTYQHEQGRKELVAKLGDRITTNYVENVPEGADAERDRKSTRLNSSH